MQLVVRQRSVRPLAATATGADAGAAMAAVTSCPMLCYDDICIIREHALTAVNVAVARALSFKVMLRPVMGYCSHPVQFHKLVYSYTALTNNN